ncbi:hypothetical protein FRC11_009624, partial [Ceratobasidium sp. 423]
LKSWIPAQFRSPKKGHVCMEKGACLAQKMHELEEQDKKAKIQGHIPHVQSEKEDQHNETVEELAEIDGMDEESTSYSIKELTSRLAQDVIDDEDPPVDNADNDANNDANNFANLYPPMEWKQSTELQSLPKCMRLFFGTQYPIPLKDLFNYNAPNLEGQGLNELEKSAMTDELDD